jgi:hypothetical protein
MTSRIPEPPSPMEAEGIPDPDAGEELEPPHDTATAVDDFGTTPAEVHAGESLDGRIAREEPDVLADAGSDADESAGSDDPRAGQGVGRLVESDEGAHEDTEAEMVATDVGTDLGGYSAEESAMHLEPEV